MGDRGNIVLEGLQREHPNASPARLFFYTHWGGSELPQILAAALDSPAGRARWADESYLARIIFCRLVEPGDDPETGFGLSLAPVDNDHPYVRVNLAARTVTIATCEWTYEEYIAAVRSGAALTVFEEAPRESANIRLS